jgi:delta 1-pyrroline-5-carboxylate dehydrogenase
MWQLRESKHPRLSLPQRLAEEAADQWQVGTGQIGQDIRIDQSGERRSDGPDRRGDKADVDDAVRPARKALEEGKWSSISPHQRARFPFKLADLIDENADQLAELESLDNGKPLAIAKVADIPGAARTFRYYAGWATKIYGETNPSDPSMFNYTLREPIGMCGLITPWNSGRLGREPQARIARAGQQIAQHNILRLRSRRRRSIRNAGRILQFRPGVHRGHSNLYRTECP